MWGTSGCAHVFLLGQDEDGGLDTHVVKHALLDVKKTSHLLVKFKICCAQINVGTTIYMLQLTWNVS